MDFIARRYYGKPHFILVGPAGAVEWAGTEPGTFRLHLRHSPWPASDADDPDAYVDEGVKCKYLVEGRCWPLPVIVGGSDPHTATLSAGESDAAREVLERRYADLFPGLPAGTAPAPHERPTRTRGTVQPSTRQQ